MSLVYESGPVIFYERPISAGATDWFHFTFGGVTVDGVTVVPSSLSAGEIVTPDPAFVVNQGLVVEGPTFYATRDELGTNRVHASVWSARIECTGSSGTMDVSVVYSTSILRQDITRTMMIPIRAT